MRLRDLIHRPHLRAFYQEWKAQEDLTLFDLLHGYVYGRWTYFYISVATGEHPLARGLKPLTRLFERVAGRRPEDGTPRKQGWADGYHGKVVPLDGARQLVRIDREIRVDDLEQVIPYKRARAIVMKNPDHIVALQCPCRTARSEPCHPMEVCLVIGEPFAASVLRHHPDRARRIDRDEAVRILEEEDARGHVHHAFFKDAMLGRFYAICNCCSCCCGAMRAHRNGTPMLASSGYLARVDDALCISCGDCLERCPFEAMAWEDGLPRPLESECMGCGICAAQCAPEAISLVLAPERGLPLEIRDLTGAA